MAQTSFVEFLFLVLLSVVPAGELPQDFLALVDPQAGLEVRAQACDDAALERLIAPEAAAKTGGGPLEGQFDSAGSAKDLIPMIFFSARAETVPK
jgi:hypothetical protein